MATSRNRWREAEGLQVAQLGYNTKPCACDLGQADRQRSDLIDLRSVNRTLTRAKELQSALSGAAGDNNIAATKGWDAPLLASDYHRLRPDKRFRPGLPKAGLPHPANAIRGRIVESPGRLDEHV